MSRGLGMESYQHRTERMTKKPKPLPVAAYRPTDAERAKIEEVVQASRDRASGPDMKLALREDGA